MNVEEYFNNLDPPLQEIARELREIVVVFFPELKEEVKWNVPTYSKNKGICSIIAHKNHVNFQIFQGAHIKEARILDCTGNDMRHIKYFTIDDISKTTVVNYLKQAVELDN